MLKKLFLALVLLSATCYLSSAQKIYYNASDKATHSALASSYVLFSKTDKGYEAKKYNSHNEMIMLGYFSNLPDDLKKSREGEFTYYHLNGKVAQQGIYLDNMLSGIWKGYSMSNGNLKFEYRYNNDSLEGLSVNYNSRTGKKASEGYYTNGKRDGEWKHFKNDTLEYTEGFVNGSQTSKTIYTSDGKISKVLYYKSKKVTGGKAYDPTGKEIPFELHKEDTGSVFMYVEQMPKTNYNLSQYLSENIVYPEDARENNEEGRVIVSFVIDEKGRIERAEIVQSVTPLLDEEALRVVKAMPDWEPGKQNGENVKVYFKLPIVFKLEGRRKYRKSHRKS